MECVLATLDSLVSTATCARALTIVAGMAIALTAHATAAPVGLELIAPFRSATTIALVMESALMASAIATPSTWVLTARC